MIPKNFTSDKPILFFDTETTGLDTTIDRVIQLSFSILYQDKTNNYNLMFNPGISIPKEASQIHGITDEMVKNKKPFSHYADFVLAKFGECHIAGYNIIKFDIPFMKKEIELAHKTFDWDNIRIIDMLTIFQKMEPRALEDALLLYTGKEMAGAHDALNDVKATIDVFMGQLNYYKNRLPQNITELHEFCNQKDDRYVTTCRKLYWRNGEPTFAFGKYQGKQLEWVAKNDSGYLLWIRSGDFSQDLKIMCNDALNGNFARKDA